MVDCILNIGERGGDDYLTKVQVGTAEDII